nr:hypothetical protein [Tanacetum cinerariifolium]
MIKDDGIMSRLKFVRIVKDYEEYGLPIPDEMLTDAVKRRKSSKVTIDSSKKLKGIQSPTPTKQAADIMQALKDS